jgi:cyclopropane fatty-acyl-phospholipid synthase-like methyltransferase
LSAILDLAETIRAGGPPDKLDYETTSQKELIDVFRGLNPGAVADAAQLMTLYDFSTTGTLLDVGGGSGGLAIAMAQANPHLKATVVDLPSVTPITQKFVDEAQLGDQVEVLTADLLRETLPGAYDVVVARHLIQVLSVEDSRTLLKNLAAVLKPGGALHLVGWILDDSRLEPQKTVGYNLILLSAYKDGQAYTEQEYNEWLVEAGFVDPRRFVKPDGASILTARKRK